MMANASQLGAGPGGIPTRILVRDSGTTPEDAGTAARAALNEGARMILGPLFGAQVAAVAGAAGKVPVITFTNNAALAAPGVHVFGVTPLQSAQTVFGFAAGQDIASIGVVVPPGPLGTLAVRAAETMARVTRVKLATPVIATSGAGFVDKLTAGNGGAMPSAVYLPSAGPELASYAAALKGSGARILGSSQWSAIDPLAIDGLNGAWFAAPDPVRFEPFARAYRDRFKAAPGILTGLAYDACQCARVLDAKNALSERGLLAHKSFDGVLGPFRFTRGGVTQRGLSVLRVNEKKLTLIGAIGI